MQDPRERLLRWIEVEARAFANSDGTTSQLRLGRVQGLLEAGVLAGYWRKRDSAAAAERRPFMSSPVWFPPGLEPPAKNRGRKE